MLDVWIRDVTVHEIIPNGHGKHVMVQWMQSYKESGWLSHYGETINALIHIPVNGGNIDGFTQMCQSLEPWVQQLMPTVVEQSL